MERDQMGRLIAGAVALILATAAPAAAAPCVAGVDVVAGQVVPCDGLLIPLEDARAAMRCRRVDLPACRADAARDLNISTAATSAAMARASAWRNLAESRGAELERLTSAAAPPPPRPWIYAAAGAAAGFAVALGAVYLAVQVTR